MNSKAMVRTALLVAFVLTALGVPLAAHHGWTGYDEKNPLTLTGTELQDFIVKSMAEYRRLAVEFQLPIR